MTKRDTVELFYILEVHVSVKKAPKPRFSSSICSVDRFKIACIQPFQAWSCSTEAGGDWTRVTFRMVNVFMKSHSTTATPGNVYARTCLFQLPYLSKVMI